MQFERKSENIFDAPPWMSGLATGNWELGFFPIDGYSNPQKFLSFPASRCFHYP